MKLIRPVIMAFSMFSSIPMPKIDWDQENMRYMLPALPLIGMVCGIGVFILGMACQTTRSRGIPQSGRPDSNTCTDHGRYPSRRFQ